MEITPGDLLAAAWTQTPSLALLDRKERHQVSRIARKGFLLEADVNALSDAALSVLIDIIDAPEA